MAKTSYGARGDVPDFIYACIRLKGLNLNRRLRAVEPKTKKVGKQSMNRWKHTRGLEIQLLHCLRPSSAVTNMYTYNHLEMEVKRIENMHGSVCAPRTRPSHPLGTPT